MTAAGLIFSNIHDSAVPELTSRRTMASIPFAGRYRLIDFPLSSMVNAGISKVGVITHYNYQSLLNHLGNGKDWDLARRNEGIKILPPYISTFGNPTAGKLYSTRLEALMGVMDFIDHCNEDTLVLSDCDAICNVDLAPVIELHGKRDADITIVTAKVRTELQMPDSRTIIPTFDGEGKLTDVADYNGQTGEIYVCTDIFVAKRTYLRQAVADAISHGYKSLYRDVIGRNIGRGKFFVHEYDGFFARINSLASYFKSSMRLLEPENRVDLFYRRGQSIYTKVRNSAPTRYTPTASVKNSLIADGCVIEGKVENSILFRGVKIGKGTTVSNCILMQDTITGENVRLNCVITDKNVVIKDGRELCGYETMPFHIGKDVMV